MTPQQVGALTETRFAYDALTRGITPNWAMVDTVGYDLIAEIRGRMYRVQVKGCNPHFHDDSPNAPRYQVNIGKNPTGGKAGQWDILAVFLHDVEKWLFYTRRQIRKSRTMFTIHRTGEMRDRARGWEVFDA